MDYETFKNGCNKELVDFINMAINYVACINKCQIVANEIISPKEVVQEEMDESEKLCLAILLAFLKAWEDQNLFADYNIDAKEICDDVELVEEDLTNTISMELYYERYFRGIVTKLGDTNPLRYFLHLANPHNSDNMLIISLLNPYLEYDAEEVFAYQNFGVVPEGKLLQFIPKEENK